MKPHLEIGYKKPTVENLFPSLEEFCSTWDEVDFSDRNQSKEEEEKAREIANRFLSGGKLSSREKKKLVWWLHPDLDTKNFPSLFLRLETLRLFADFEERYRDIRVPRYLFNGLVYSFFQVRRDEYGHHNVRMNIEKLRNLILCFWEKIRTEKKDEDQSEYTSMIFSPKAEEIFAQKLLNNDLEIFDWAVEQFRIPNQCWFWESVFEKFCQWLGRINEAIFQKNLNFYTSLLSTNDCATTPLMALNRNKVWVSLVNRVAISNRNGETEADFQYQRIKEYCLSTWGNPQNPSTKKKLLRVGVSEEAIKMMCSWFAREDLKFFFDVLHYDIARDRIDFWEEHIPDMTFTAVVLSQNRRYDGHIYEYKRENEGRYAESWDAPANTDAFIMAIGGFVFVEFSQNSNACYFYGRLKDKAIRLNWTYIDVPKVPFDIYSRFFYFRDELKGRNIGLNTSSQNRIIHSYGWEEKAEDLIALAKRL